MAEFSIPKIRFKWKGIWASGTEYIKDDIVLYGGRSYVAEDPHTSAVSFETDLNASRWTVVTDGRQWRDEWQPATTYRINDIVLRSGAVYICTGIHTSTTRFEDNSSDWQLFVDSDGWDQEWQPSTKYSINAVVRYNGIVYRCITAHESNTTIAGLEVDQAKWEVLYEGVQYVGDWAESTRYRVNDIVEYGGSLWRCAVGHTSTDDSTINFDEARWNLEVPGHQFRGEWLSSVLYVPGDVVRYGGYLYQATTSTVGIPPSLVTSSDWRVVDKNYNFREDWSSAETYRTGDVVRRGGNLYTSTVDQYPTAAAGTKRFIVTVGPAQLGQTGFKYYIDGEYRPSLQFEVGWTYVFDQSDLTNRYFPNEIGGSLNPHPFSFSADNYNGLLGSGTVYSTNVVYKVDGVEVPQSAYQSTIGSVTPATLEVEITITENTPETLYYYCANHLNMGSVLHIVAANSGADPNIDASWTLLTEGNRFRNFYQDGESYAINDVVTYKGKTWNCTYPHVADALYNFPDNGNGVFYWEVLAEGDTENGLTQAGDLVTIGVEQDGSSIGPIEVPVGVPESLLMVGPEQTLFYKKWGIAPKVYYVAPHGLDLPGRGTTLNEPWKTVRYATENITGPATIFVKTGRYLETLPIIVPENVAIVGDELRSTRIEPAPAVPELANDATYTLTVLSRMKNILGDVITGNLIDKSVGNAEIQNTDVYRSGTNAETAILDLIDDMSDYINFYINEIGSEPTMTGTNTAVTDEEFVNAVLALESNKEFLAAEAVAFMQTAFPLYNFDPESCKRDMRAYIDAWKYDIIYTGNYKSLLAARYYRNAVLGSETEDMFYVRNASGIRNMTLAGLNGTLAPNNVDPADQRPTAGAYVSLDPGWGPDDNRCWITTRSPYIQNVTTFGVGCVGQKIDGNLHNGGNKSIVSNDFTQVLSDGIGAWVSNRGLAELVSVFTYYNHIGYLADNGGKIRATNGNNSYGNYGAVAVGNDDTEVPLEAIVNNRNQEAIIDSAFAGEANDELLVFEFKNAGQEYTSATYSLVSSGVGASVIANEFRDDGVFNVRLINPQDSSVYTAGGFGYKEARNNAQGGDTLQIQLASNDESLPAEYIGMRLTITSGTGTGQYGYIQNYSNISKIATIYRESDDTPGWDHVIPGYPIDPVLDTTTVYRIEPRLTFSPPPFTATAGSTATSSNWKDLIYVETVQTYNNVTATQGTGLTIEVPLAQATFNVTRSGLKYTVTLVNGGAGYNVKDQVTISGASLGGVSPDNDITVTVTSTTDDSTNSIVTFNYDGRAVGGNFVAIATNSNIVNWSNDGSVWSSITMPTSEAWVALAGGFIGTTSLTVAIASSGTRAASSINGGVSWTNRVLPTSADWIDVAYGDERFLAISSTGDVAVSTSGTIWSSTTSLPALTTASGWKAIAYGKETWVAIADGVGSTQAAYSTDNGTTWNNVTLPSSDSWTSIAYGNNRFVAVAEESVSISYSFDGITWYLETLPSPGLSVPTIAYGQGLFMIVQSNSTSAYTSEDCQTWTERTLSLNLTWTALAFGNPSNDGKWITIAQNIGNNNIIRAGAVAKGRAVLSNSTVTQINIWEPGSGYDTAPTLTLTDPNNSAEISPLIRIGKGALAQPTFLNRGTAYKTSTTRVTVTGNGFGDVVPVGKFVTIDGLLRYPRPGANLTFNSNPLIYRVVTIEELGGIDGYYKAKIRVEPELKEVDNILHNDSVTIREKYSQVRLTGHDFLEIGSGNFEQTNYPGARLGVLAPENEVFQKNGGRVFYTSTDQDGNFRVGELFAVDQATGTVTISADFFDLRGLTELALGGVRLGGTGAVVREFSTDPLFTADSNNVVPTQRAIKAYLDARLTTGGSEVSTGSLIAGLVKVGPGEIRTTTGAQIELPRRMNIEGPKAGVSGLILAQTFYYRDFGS